MKWGLFFSNTATTLPPNKRNKSCSIICKNSMNSIIRIKIKFNALVIVIIISHHHYSSPLVIVIVINHCQQSLSLVIVITHCHQLLSLVIANPKPNPQCANLSIVCQSHVVHWVWSNNAYWTGSNPQYWTKFVWHFM